MSSGKRIGRRKGSSNAGRPRKAGARYPSGKLKPPPPSAVTIAKRKAGDAEAGEHPMDFALSQGWLTQSDHQAANAYRAAFNRSHIGAPRISSGSLNEAVPTEELRVDWLEVSDEEIAEIFDRVFNVTPDAASPEKQEAAALALWKRLNVALTLEEREELFRVSVLGSWPFWMPKHAAGKELRRKDRQKVATLLNALGAVSRALRPAKPKGDKIISLPHKATRQGRAEQPVRYETQHGEEITPTSERGAPFEVTVLRKRG